MTKLEFNSLCRLCVQLLEKEKVSPIFNNKFYEDKVSLPERIKYCSSVEVAEDDGLPPQICSSCLLKLDLSFTFRNQCVLADITLKQLKDINCFVNEVPDLFKVDINNQIIRSENDFFDNFKYFFLKKEDDKKILFNSVNPEKRNEINSSEIPEQNSYQNLNFESSTIENYNCEEKPQNIQTNSQNIKKNKERLKKIESCKENQITSKVKSKTKYLKKTKVRKLKNDSQLYDGESELKIKTEMKSISADTEISSNSHDENNDNVDNAKKCVKLKRKNGRLKRELVGKEKPTSYTCDYCQKVYPSEGGWRYHIYTMHNENYQPFICDLCGQTFKVKKNLEGHKNSVHFRLKLHLCDLCGRGFASKYALKVHKIWHNDEKNFSCDICGTKFRTRGKMNTHRSIHGGPKKFMCHICSRDFRWKKDFEIHMRTHTGEKPFKCSHCGKAFASLTNMKKHERSHVRKLNSNKNSELYEISSTTIDDRLYRNAFLDFEYETEDVRNRPIHTEKGTD